MLGEGSGCSAFNTQESTPYGYLPSERAGIIFVVVFGLSFIFHSAQATWKKQWWAYVFAVGTLSEVLGWAARLWSAKCPYNSNAFLIQLATLVIGPTFYTAGLYIILGQFIHLMGRQTSPLSERAYLWIFCTCDLISLVVQAIGGGIAATAIDATPERDIRPGTDVMVAGILFQMASVAVFTVFFGIFIFRVRHCVVSTKTKALLGATAISIVMIYTRSIYRTIELLQGWNGYLLNHEVYFIILDGSLMVVCGGVFNIIHPGWFLDKPRKTEDTVQSRLGTCLSAMSEVGNDCMQDAIPVEVVEFGSVPEYNKVR